jgi:hypothetical protein
MQACMNLRTLMPYQTTQHVLALLSGCAALQQLRHHKRRQLQQQRHQAAAGRQLSKCRGVQGVEAADS